VCTIAGNSGELGTLQPFVVIQKVACTFCDRLTLFKKFVAICVIASAAGGSQPLSWELGVFTDFKSEKESKEDYIWATTAETPQW